MITPSFNSIVFLIIASRAQSIESTGGESHGGGPVKGHTALKGNRRGNTGEQKQGERGLRGGIQEVETEGKKVPQSSSKTHFASISQPGRSLTAPHSSTVETINHHHHHLEVKSHPASLCPVLTASGPPSQ